MTLANPNQQLLSQIERAIEDSLDSINAVVAKKHHQLIGQVVELAFVHPSKIVLDIITKLAQSLKVGPRQADPTFRLAIKRLETYNKS